MNVSLFHRHFIIIHLLDFSTALYHNKNTGKKTQRQKFYLEATLHFSTIFIPLFRNVLLFHFFPLFSLHLFVRLNSHLARFIVGKRKKGRKPNVLNIWICSVFWQMVSYYNDSKVQIWTKAKIHFLHSFEPPIMVVEQCTHNGRHSDQLDLFLIGRGYLFYFYTEYIFSRNSLAKLSTIILHLYSVPVYSFSCSLTQILSFKF